MRSEPYKLLGAPRRGGVLIIGDHASNHVPDDIDLGIDAASLQWHIAWDIGVAAVAERMVERYGFAAWLGGVSRLVVDYNRYAGEAGVIPLLSDGVDLPGNALSAAERELRLDRFFCPYHDDLAHLLKDNRPSLILSLHSFTPALETQPDDQRPWEIGILYNEYETASEFAIFNLRGKGMVVGDQQPYSGKLLNATMNRHAEAKGIPYVGVEMRQDLVADQAGAERFAHLLGEMCHFVSETLGETAQKP